MQEVIVRFPSIKSIKNIFTEGELKRDAVVAKFATTASGILKEYMRKGFALDDERLKNLGGGGYFKELLERIRDIRASEKVFYRQVLEIYATSIDYDPKAEISVQFSRKFRIKFIMLFTDRLRQK